MEGNLNRSISAYLDKKRKLNDDDELFEPPLPNHLRWVQKKLKGNILAGPFESDQESEKGSSNSFGVITTDHHTESSSYDCSSASCPKAQECFEPSSSSANWGGTGTSCEIDMCSSESVSFENLNYSISQPLSISEDVDPPYDDDYEDHRLLEISGYKTDGYDHLQDLDNLLNSNGLAPSSYSYVPSSGILPVNQDNKRRGNAKKLTIDKEFEQYFSSLML